MPTETDLCVDEPVPSAPAHIDPFHLLTAEERAAAVFVKARLETAPPFVNTVVMAEALVPTSTFTAQRIVTGREQRRTRRTADQPDNNTVCRFRSARHGTVLDYYVAVSYGVRTPGQRVCDECIRYCERSVAAIYEFRRVDNPTPVDTTSGADTMVQLNQDHMLRSGHFMYGTTGHQVRITRAGVRDGQPRWHIQYRSQYDVDWRRGVWTSHAYVTQESAERSHIIREIIREGGFHQAAQRWYNTTHTCIGCARRTTNWDGFSGDRCRSNWRMRR